MNNFKIFFFILFFINLNEFIFNQLLSEKDCQQCRIRIDRKIVGGKEVQKSDSFPFQASLAIAGIHFCGATIINRLFVMTAYHCVSDFQTVKQISRLAIRVGLIKLNDSQIRSKTYFAKKIYFDSRYNGPVIGFDFAMIELQEPGLTFTNQVQASCLPKTFEHYNDRVGSLNAIGWGSVNKKIVAPDGKESKSIISNILKVANFNYIKCENHLICVQPVKGDYSSTCFGDSGGGLIHDKQGYRRVVGIVQYVLGKKDKYGNTIYCYGDGGFSRVTEYLPMIRNLTNGDFCQFG